MAMHPLLLELGTEELPVKALPGLAQALFDGVLSALDRHGIAVERGIAKPLYTPRRLAVLLPAVADEQPEQTSELLGPYLNIALDAQGNPTRALQGFAAKAGLDWTALERVTDHKGERFVHRAVTPGATTAALLPAIVHEAVAGMPIPKPMRWGDRSDAFARPLHWLVLLLGQEVVDVELFGVRADRFSRGHRFMHDQPVSLAGPQVYQQALHDAQVLVDPDQRRDRITREVHAAASAVHGQARIDPDNLEQVNCLTEWPVAVACTFERAFLSVPSEALITTMETNQKFFPVLDANGVLSEHFVGIANIASRDVTQVRQGYERVIRPRFADARFFYDEDLKQGLLDMGRGLATVTYQARLGTLADKVQRVAALAATIGGQMGVDPAQARRAAEVSKNDLQSRMVNEFPELQGIAGRHYAVAGGEPAAIALAIDEAYQPRFSGDDIALSPLGKVLAIAERLDTLAGGFAAGLKPTGNKDPFALRRTALGMARTIIESGLDLNLVNLLAHSEQQARQALAATMTTAPAKEPAPTPNTPDAAVDALYDFVLDRLRGYYSDKGVPAAHFNAVAEKRPASLYDLDRRIDAIGEFSRLPEASALAAANKRIGNLLKKAVDQIPGLEDPALLREPAERALAEAVEAAYGETGPALAHGDYVTALTHLARLRPHVDAFFDQVMVNVDDTALRNNRLALLKRLSDRLGAVAAIEHLDTP